MSYYTARLEEFNALRHDEMYACRIRVVLENGVSVQSVGIKTPTKRRKPISGNQGPYTPDLTSTFDLLRSDFQSMLLSERKQFIRDTTHGVETWDIIEILDDEESEPTVQFKAQKKI